MKGKIVVCLLILSLLKPAFMIEYFSKLHSYLNDCNIRLKNDEFRSVVQDYLFLHIKEVSNLKENEKMIFHSNIKKSKVIVIDMIEEYNEAKRYLILGFEKTLLIHEIDSSSFSFLHDILSINSNMPTCFLSNAKKIFSEMNEIQNQVIEIDENFNEEINILKSSLQCRKTKNPNNRIWPLVIPCISGYLIKKSYLNSNEYRIQKFIHNLESHSNPEIIDEDEYIELRNVGLGFSFKCVLAYHIKRGELHVIKKPNSIDKDISKLIERETSNYSKIKHPLLPKFIAKIKDKNYLVIEYINGQELCNIKNMQLTFNDKLAIIFQLMLIIKYFHDNQLVYRDLKPNNVLIDANKTVVLIDFDRLIDNNNNNSTRTMDLGSKFSDPEISNSGNYSYKSDIYSLGKMIEYIFGMDDMNMNSMGIFQSEDYAKIIEIFHKCTSEQDENIPSISSIIQEFASKFQFKIQIDNLLEDCKTHLCNFEIINKATHNNSESLFNLGLIYRDGLYVTRDVNKAIDYFQLSSDQNYSKAQLKLGNIYFHGEYVKCDIEKAIHYYRLAANQSNPKAQLILGFIYYEGKYVKFDISTAIHYFSLASSQNNSKAQFILGTIYEEGLYVMQNLNKAIYYYSLSADQNYSDAQFNLANIYYLGIHVKFDIDKAIHYYLLAAEQNNSKAQYVLGTIYEEGKFVKQDIQKGKFVKLLFTFC